ncbi:PAS domain S-box protein [Bacteroidota bacterium]
MPRSEIENYKTYVSTQLSKLSPLLQNYAMGGFSTSIPIPEEENKFTELFVAINLMVDDFREMLVEREETIAELHRTQDKLKNYQEHLEELVEKRSVQLKRFEKFVESSNQGFGMATLDGEIVYTNPALQKMIQVKNQKDVEGLKYPDLYPDNLRKKLENEVFPALIKTGTWEGELAFFNNGGGLINTYESFYILKDDEGNPEYIADFITDITEKIEAERCLRDQQRFLDGIYTGVDLPIFVVDVTEEGEMRFSGLNPAHERLTGFTSEWIKGKTPEELYPRIPKGVINEIRGHYQECLDAGHSIQYEEMIPMDGKDMWWLTTLTPLKGRNGRIYRIIGSAMSITGRKQVEEAILFERNLLSTLMDNIPDAIFFKDNKSKFIRVNKAQAKVFGEEETNNVIGKSDADYLPANLVKESLLEEKNIIKNSKPVFNKIKNKTIKPGVEDRWISVSKVPINGPDGKIMGIVGVSRDITKLKQSENELIKLNEELEKRVEERTADLKVEKEFSDHLINSLPGIFYMFDKSLHFTRWNKNLEKVTGYNSEEITKISPLDLFTGETKKRVAMKIGEVFLKGESSVEGNFVTKTGEKIPYYFTGKLIKRGKKPYLIGMGIDIAKRKQAEEARETLIKKLGERIKEMTCLNQVNEILKNTKLTLREMLQEITEAIPQGWLNPDITQCRVRYEDMETKSAKFRKSIHVLTKSLHSDEVAVGKIEVSLRRKMPDEDIGPFLTEEKRLLKTIVNVIEREIARRKAEEELKKILLELERSNKELEQFAYVASHDLQEPLRMVSSYTQLLEKRYKEKLDEDARDFIHYAVDGANRMQILINDLLQYSRITTRGKEFKKVYLNSVLGQAIINMKRRIEETHGIITHEELPELNVDESQITRLFQNLISNSLKYRSNGSPRVHISNKNSKTEVKFFVKDNGIGIAPQFQGRVFEIFQRLHTKDKYEGTGIGLAICKRIIERHGGRIWVESEDGKGSTFCFTIKKNL